MISYPKDWKVIGQPTIFNIIDRLKCILLSVYVKNLSFSGGVDSTILLHFMTELLGKPINCYTVAKNNLHPDYIFSKQMADLYEAKHFTLFLDEQLDSDLIVKKYYEWLDKQGVTDIVVGDCVDEYNAGYYIHQDLSYDTYYDFISRLQSNHLEPLNSNSKYINVYIPYADSILRSMFSDIPLDLKVDKKSRKKIISEIAKETGSIPIEIINRWKYGFCDATKIKE